MALAAVVKHDIGCGSARAFSVGGAKKIISGATTECFVY